MKRKRKRGKALQMQIGIEEAETVDVYADRARNIKLDEMTRIVKMSWFMRT